LINRTLKWHHLILKALANRVGDREITPKNTVKQRDIGIKTPLSNYQGRQIFDMHNDPTVASQR